MLYKVVLMFVSVDEILKRDHSNESYWAVLSCDSAVYYAVQVQGCHLVPGAGDFPRLLWAQAPATFIVK